MIERGTDYTAEKNKSPQTETSEDEKQHDLRERNKLQYLESKAQYAAIIKREKLR